MIPERPNVDEREEALAHGEAQLAKREWFADERDRIADQRVRIANERERVADEREFRADEREGTAGERERERLLREDERTKRLRATAEREQADIARDGRDRTTPRRRLILAAAARSSRGVPTVEVRVKVCVSNQGTSAKTITSRRPAARGFGKQKYREVEDDPVSPAAGMRLCGPSSVAVSRRPSTRTDTVDDRDGERPCGPS